MSYEPTTTRPDGVEFIVERPRIVVNGRGDMREAMAAQYLGCSVRKLQSMRDCVGAYRLRGTWWYPIAKVDEYIEELIRFEEWKNNAA